jgi:transposase
VDFFRFAEKESTMGKHPRSYPPEFRRKITELVRSGRSGNQVAEEFKISRQTLSNWLKQDDLDSGRRSDGLTSAEHEENVRLRKRIRQLEIEREILSKAAAWFARETDSVPPKSSSS